MTVEEIIESLEEQAEEKDRKAGGDPDSPYTREATVLLEAARLLKEGRQNCENL